MRILILMLVLLSFTNTAFAESKCTHKDAIAADDEASELKDWNSIYKSFKKFSHCDDGSISEGYSNSIAYLLSDGWDSLDELHTLISKDKQFGKFVISHVDGLMTYEQAKQIYINVRSKCPAKEKKLCKRIEKRLNETPTGTDASTP